MSADASDSAGAAILPPQEAPSKLSQMKSRITWAKLKQRMKDDPLVFAFLGLTVVALTRGIGAMMRDDKRLSQRMMRQRVAFQLCTVGALVGGMYWRAFKSGSFDTQQVGRVAVDNRMYLTAGRNYDLPADAAGGAAEAGEGGQAAAEQQLR